MSINMDLIRELREKTGAGVMDCKKALISANGDVEKAVEILRKEGIAVAEKKGARLAKDGRIESYIHPGNKLGVMVEVNCETDFVARTDEFKTLTKEIAMHIAASNPRYISIADIPEDVLESEKDIYVTQAQNEGKPPQVIERIVQGKLEKFYQEVCLLEQPWIRDPEKKIKDIINDAIARLGENILIRRFVRFELGKD
ncbi:MAG TPA: translation elongation factor Ts [bacterium]|nr:translation elongation factor Ts [Dictyoglomota bacterium]HOK29267.1 translation elongation factor Ts [bacterium]HOL54280.1 translation elongation factor Ts [bacterium]HPC77216.1 translation elongation factor Ts [bacterium]HPO81811.1 translation elongation factor Ts [bacterium]